ncbi:3-deoxy-D-manno-octulosonic acid transferase [Novipirellula artificiosorum]|uniref:3-deoxy-D-manno-octulosonic acid transferase n=1 Tax=Novipirellula artificiosorum TaxID=2528016 RepID=A0A5C6DYX0_9BACT|nr:3-deoxy-D-manno-octulosonic acid transferase [Novipirellula artificiosorum]TWU41037.1 3-deoxy-D-manno-octulosonic acid transferase [Novipirellula artificiosorum]
MFANLIYFAALLLVSPVVLYRMVRHGRYRRGVREKVLGLSASHARNLSAGKRCIWIHAVSVGEVNLVRGVAMRLQQQHPDTPVLISTSTDTGYDLAIRLFGAQRVFFCPLDFSWAVARAIRNLNPQLLLLAELELWPNLIRMTRDHGCPVMVINARLSESSANRYQRFGAFTRRTFARLSWVGCQNEATASRFLKCGSNPDRLEVTGSIKFDDAPTSRDTVEVQSRQQWAGVDPWNRVWVGGSTGPGEEAMVIRVYQSLRSSHHQLRLVLVPRHVERFDAVAKLVEQSGLKVHRRSTGKSRNQSSWESDTVVLVDTIGELRHWWGVSQIATVGGSFGDRGGQNMLEPAGYGSAVSFGPDTRNFKEIANQLVAEGGAARVADESELRQFVTRCLDDIPAADCLGRNARRVIGQHQGAKERTLASIEATLQSDDTHFRAA